MTLPEPLGALGEYPQFILWKLVQFDGEPKPRKMPVDGAGRTVDAQDPTNWMSAEAAYTLAGIAGLGVGFVFTENDPFFFIDIDHCRNADGSWTDLANQICAQFQGAATEVSQSGEGLHIFGCGTVPEGYKTKNQSLGLEVYSARRFVALGGAECWGDVWLDWTAALGAFVPGYMEPQTEVGDLTGWTTEPRADWNGPEDDEELIVKMLGSGGAGAMFGGVSKMQALWNADETELGNLYPDGYSGRTYDASSADAALASQLAFWTGCNCERMDRLMRRSALKRDKWDTHRSYMTRTISGAASRCGAVYTAGNRGALATEVGPSVAVQSEGGFGAIMTVEEQHGYFMNCVYVASRNQVYQAGAGWIKPEAFNHKYGGHEFLYTYEGKTTRKALEAFTQNQLPNTFLKADATWFRPDLTQLGISEDNGTVYLNTYIDPNVPVSNGDVTPFLDFMARFIPDARDREILLCYIAAVIQHQGVKFQWCPVIQGAQGNGKGLLSSVIKFAVGGPDHRQKYVYTVPTHNLEDGGLKFNAWVEDKVYIDFDEIYTRDRHNLIEALKPYVTNEYIEIQGKGADQRMGRNCANYMMFTNHRDAMPKSIDDRRYAMFYSGQQTHADIQRDYPGSYMSDMWDWLRNGGYEAIAGFLRGYEIRGGYNPAGGCHRAPDTSSTQAAITESLGTVEQEVMEWVEQERIGFRGGWVSSHMLDIALRDSGMARRIGRNKRKDMMYGLGYVKHPSLKNGRVPSGLYNEEGKKPVLYILKSLAVENAEPGWVVAEYERAQNYSAPPAVA